MKRDPKPAIRPPSSAMPAFAGALVASAYLVGAVVFSAVSQQGPVEPAAAAEQPRLVQIATAELATAGLSTPGLSTTGPLPEPVLVNDRPVIAANQVSDAVRPAASVPSGPQIALVIDDVGLDLAAARRAVALDAGISVAILPYAAAAAQISGEAAAAGHDVLLHMPMEPVGLADPGPNALRVALTDADLAARMRWALAQVPDAVGLNNHMGSRFTADPRAMRVALAAVSERNPLFLDSMTTAHSRGRAAADGLGLRTLERDIFLDHEIDAGAIAARLEEAETLARDRGWAVVIGHPHGETLDVLETWAEAAQARGIELVRVSELAERLAVRNVATAGGSQAVAFQ